MKVGILTFHNAINYGAVLQAYALQQFLKKDGYDAEIIDYRNDYFKKFYSPFYIEKLNLRKIIYMLYSFRQKMRRLKQFGKFRSDFLIQSKEIYYPNTISKIDNVYDCIVVGSDQVWNLTLIDGDPNYLLPFCKKTRKITYAASIGLKKIPDEYDDVFAKNIPMFDTISVREKSAVRLLKQYTEKEIEVSNDPVLLLDKKEWKKVVIDTDYIVKGNYIVVYKINKNDLYDKAEELSKKTGQPVVVIKPDRSCNFDCIKVKGASPQEFVSLFYNAKYIITDSFHGSVFSIIFGKKFIYIPDVRPDNKNIRIFDLLRKFNLESRVYNNSIEEIYNPIDLKSIQGILDKERKQSADYLRKAI